MFATEAVGSGLPVHIVARLLGHANINTTQAYISDLALKERALARTTPIDAVPGRYQPTDTIMAFLDNL